MAWQASEDGGHKSKERKVEKEKDGRAGLSPGAEKSEEGKPRWSWQGVKDGSYKKQSWASNSTPLAQALVSL